MRVEPVAQHRAEHVLDHALERVAALDLGLDDQLRKRCERAAAGLRGLLGENLFAPPLRGEFGVGLRSRHRIAQFEHFLGVLMLLAFGDPWLGRRRPARGTRPEARRLGEAWVSTFRYR